MRWRDLLYFSKGERRALTLLLSLIAAAWLVLICTNPVHQRMTDVDRPDSALVLPVKSQERHIQKKDNIQPEEKAIRTQRSVNPPRRKTDSLFKRYPQTEKYPEGTIVELNSADTVALKKIPGIGSAFARRITKYRELLGGFYTVEQLAEVYGIDEERYNAIKSWFSVDLSAIRQLRVNYMSTKELACHPYVSYKQAHSIEQLVRQKGKLTGWENVSLLEEFTEADHKRLNAYLSFQ